MNEPDQIRRRNSEMVRIGIGVAGPAVAAALAYIYLRPDLGTTDSGWLAGVVIIAVISVAQIVRGVRSLMHLPPAASRS